MFNFLKTTISFQKGEYDTPIAAIQHVSYSNKSPKTEITDGGLNFTHVELKISSARSYGIHSTVTIFWKLVNETYTDVYECFHYRDQFPY